MSKFLIRLDDACEHMCIERWSRMEAILDEFKIKPIVGLIPSCEDPEILKYEQNNDYVSLLINWKAKEWELALHGFNHVYISEDGGINPVNLRSEFAGLPLDIQKAKIKQGISILQQLNISPRIFFAPSHTFDKNTLLALKSESTIRIISDTIASNCYTMNGFLFVPQQAGRGRALPVKIATFCFHPNTMSEEDFDRLYSFLKKRHSKAICFNDINLSTNRKKSLYDSFLNLLYFTFRKIRRKKQ